MPISNCLFSPTSENPSGFCLRQFAALVSVWSVLAKLSCFAFLLATLVGGTTQLLIAETVVINSSKINRMDKLFKSNIYTDIVWLLIGVIGGIYYFSKNRYWICAIFSVLALLYIAKIIRERMLNKSRNSE